MSYHKALLAPERKSGYGPRVSCLDSLWYMGLSITPCQWQCIGLLLSFHPNKYNFFGILDQHKTWLVVREFTQAHGDDNIETCSGVVRMKSIYILLSIVVNQEWIISKLDVSNPFSI